MPQGGAAEPSGGDDSFWDRQVAVPEKGSDAGLQPPTQQPNGQAAHSVAPQLQQQAAIEAAAPASSNEIARLFAGIKVSSSSAAPGGPGRAALAPVQLLTPQLLQQEAASAAATAPAETAPEAAAGTALLQSLLRGSGAAPAAVAAPALAQPHPVDITGWCGKTGSCCFPHALQCSRQCSFHACCCPVCPAEAADRVLRSKVSSLLSSLANNEAFCGILGAELKKAGLV